MTLDLKGYVALQHLGGGSYGDVFLAKKTDDASGNAVAIKRFKHLVAQPSQTDVALIRYLQGVKSATAEATLNEIQLLRYIKKDCNPYFTCELQVLSDEHGLVYVIMEFPGAYESLYSFNRHWLEYIKSDPATLVADGRQTMRRIYNNLLDAVASLHAIGVVHRDIKPHNIIINPDTLHVRLIDFGTACAIAQNASGQTVTLCSDPQRGTSTSMYYGTEDFLSPEEVLLDALTRQKLHMSIEAGMSAERPRDWFKVDVWRAGMSFLSLFSHGHTVISVMEHQFFERVDGLYWADMKGRSDPRRTSMLSPEREFLSKYLELYSGPPASIDGYAILKQDHKFWWFFKSKVYDAGYRRLVADGLDAVSVVIRVNPTFASWFDANRDVTKCLQASLDYDVKARQLQWSDAPLKIEGYEMVQRLRLEEGSDAEGFLARKLDKSGGTLLVKRYPPAATAAQMKEQEARIKRELSVLDFLKGDACTAFSYCRASSGTLTDASKNVYTLFQFFPPENGGSTSSSGDGAVYISLREYAAVLGIFYNAESHIVAYQDPRGIQLLREILKNMVRALESLHKGGVIHRGITTETVLIDPKSLDVRIIGFGDACLLPSDAKAVGYTEYLCPFSSSSNDDDQKQKKKKNFSHNFYSPEQLTGKFAPTTRDAWRRVDIWALGMVYASLLFGLDYVLAYLYEATDKTSGNVYEDLVKLHPIEAKWLEENGAIASTLKSMLQMNPQDRQLAHVECKSKDTGECYECRSVPPLTSTVQCTALCGDERRNARCKREAEPGSDRCAEHKLEREEPSAAGDSSCTIC